MGAFATEDPHADGYYLVKWVDEPRTLNEDLVLNEFDRPIVLGTERRNGGEGKLFQQSSLGNKVVYSFNNTVEQLDSL